MADLLQLGGIIFTDFSPPERMGAGGKHALIIHKLPGGSRVIDTLGPDEADITWNGHFFSNDAYSTALALDAMRVAGEKLPLIWGGQFRQVFIESFSYHVRRLPVWVEYQITCSVYQNPAMGNLATSSPGAIDTMVSSDLGAASSAAGADGSFVSDDLSTAGTVG